MHRMLPAMLVIAGSCALNRAASSEDAALAVEVVAVRSVTGQYALGVLHLDSVFAHPDQAPPAMTGQLRPTSRHRALADSIRKDIVRTSRDTLRVRASEPRISGRVATISVTIDGRLVAGHPRNGFYETVALVLYYDGSRWIVRKRTQLGIS